MSWRPRWGLGAVCGAIASGVGASRCGSEKNCGEVENKLLNTLSRDFEHANLFYSFKLHESHF